jgi:perosamine synthetase
LKRIISIAKPLLGKEELEAVKEVFESGELVQGKKVRLFEEEFAKYICVKHAVAVSNGTAALDLALKALGVRQGDEVVTSAFSFIASGNCALFQGAKPVFADIDPKTFNIDPADVAKKITTKTKAIIPIHLFGQPVIWKELKEISDEREIALIEDAAQALGAEYRGQKTGSMGMIGCFSFYPTKNITTVEGGMITTNNSEIAERVRLLKDHGQSAKYRHVVLGHNYRMTEVSAAVGLIQLKKLDAFNERRRNNANLLTDGIRRIDGITPPYVINGVKHVFNQFVVRIEDNFPKKRDKFAEHLKKLGVGVTVHYPMPIYKQPLYNIKNL